MAVVLTCSVSSSWMLPLLTDTVEFASLMADLLLARRGQQPVELFCAPCWLDREVLRLVLKPTDSVMQSSLYVISSVNSWFCGDQTTTNYTLTFVYVFMYLWLCFNIEIGKLSLNNDIDNVWCLITIDYLCWLWLIMYDVWLWLILHDVWLWYIMHDIWLIMIDKALCLVMFDNA